MKKSFDNWMKDVDREVWAKAGCSVYDLPDACFVDWYDDGMSAIRAARKAIKNAKDE